jgi:hypothetical protein
MKKNLLKIILAAFLFMPAKLFAQFTVYNTSNSGLAANHIYIPYTTITMIYGHPPPPAD